VKAPGQALIRRLLQSRLAGALGVAAEKTRKVKDLTDVPELRCVQQFARSDVATKLDPPGPKSMAVAVAKDCTTLIDTIAQNPGKDYKDRANMAHHMLQLQSAHVAQFKCEAEAASLEVYEVKEAEQAATQMERVCEGVRVTAAFFESADPRVELRTHGAPGDRTGVFAMIRPRPDCEDDFSYLAKEVCPQLAVRLASKDGSAAPRLAFTSPVHMQNMTPVCVQSSHPSVEKDQAGGKIAIPFATGLKVTVDNRSCLGGTLSFYHGAGDKEPFLVVHRDEAPGQHAKPVTFEVPRSEFWYTYQHERGASLRKIEENWGFEFQVVVNGEPSKRAQGMLLQAVFDNVGPGEHDVSASLCTRGLEFNPRQLSSCTVSGQDLRAMVSPLDDKLLLDGVACQKHRLRQPAMVLGINGVVATSKKHLQGLAADVDTSAQVIILTAPEHSGKGIQKLLKDRLPEIQEATLAAFGGALAARF